VSVEENTWSRHLQKSPIKVAVTGAAGQIGYSLLPRLASGGIFGPDQPIDLHLIEIPPALKALEGVVMELHDCAFPLLHDVVPTVDLDEGFQDVNWALLVGSVPRRAGMGAKTCLNQRKIFVEQEGHCGRAASTRVLAVGNPAIRTA
jgi:malate dehydrogenase